MAEDAVVKGGQPDSDADSGSDMINEDIDMAGPSPPHDPPTTSVSRAVLALNDLSLAASTESLHALDDPSDP